MNSSEDSIVSADRRSVLLVILSRMAHLGEIFVGSKHGSTEPHGVPLDHVLEHIAVDLGIATGLLVISLHSLVDSLLQVRLETVVEASEEGASTGQHDVLVQFDSVVNGAPLDGLVHDLLQGLGPVFVDEFL